MYIADAIYMVIKDCEIRACNLRGNSLKKFPKKMVTKFPRLSVINLEGNQIEEIPQEITGWTELTGINLAGNRLKAVPDCIYELRNLAILDLGSNLIEDIDIMKLTTALPNLKKLSLIGNPVAETKRSQLQSHSSPSLQIKLD
ncbi:leucine Rich Repeat family protein [Aphelenchoides avenae]|nr:leucine Rich Repeat family protein [Aphelenchus avenae]